MNKHLLLKYLQYRGTLNNNSAVAVGVLLFAANLIMMVGPFLIIGLVAFRALPMDFVQKYLGDEAPLTSPAVTDSDSAVKV